jgi:hypothetical protein
MSERALRLRLRPFGALASGAAGWFGHHQLLADAQRFDCGFGGPWVATLAGIVALAVIAAGCAWTWPARRVPQVGASTEAERFLAELSLTAAAIFALTVVVQVIASWIVPECAA